MTYQSPPRQFETDPKSKDVPPMHVAQELTGDGNLASICHDGKVYTLRITRNGKLILTK